MQWKNLNTINRLSYWSKSVLKLAVELTKIWLSCIFDWAFPLSLARAIFSMDPSTLQVREEHVSTLPYSIVMYNMHLMALRSISTLPWLRSEGSYKTALLTVAYINASLVGEIATHCKKPGVVEQFVCRKLCLGPHFPRKFCPTTLPRIKYPTGQEYLSYPRKCVPYILLQYLTSYLC